MNRTFSLDSLPSEHSCNSCYYCTQPVAASNELTPEPSFGKRQSISTSTKSPNYKAKRRKSSRSAKLPKNNKMKSEIIEFFTTYCGAQNWLKGSKINGIQKYNLKFEDRLINNASIEFIYSFLLYLGKIIGINKKCITHSLSLFYCRTSQINTLCDEMALILQTLEYHNNQKLWKYIYSFIHNIAAYFQYIQPFISSCVVIKNQLKSIEINKTYHTEIQTVRIFFTVYSDTKNWKQATTKNTDFQTYTLYFGERDAINARMSFIYSMTCYLIEIVGANKSMKSMIFILFKSISGQIDTFCKVWKIILDTLEYHNDNILWKYVYSYLYNIHTYYKYLYKFIGKKTMVNDTNNYCIRLRGNCMYYINQYKGEVLITGYCKELNNQWNIWPVNIIQIIQKYYIKQKKV